MRNKVKINEIGLVEPFSGEHETFMTHFQGNFTTTYKILKSLFGEPDE